MIKEKYNAENFIFLIIFIGIGALIAYFSVGREYFTFAVETDYLGGFLSEARNILHGRPLNINFHPPLYPAAIAVFQLLTGDWVVTGLMVSWIASLVVIYTQFEFFRRLDSSTAAFGAIIALGCSEAFLLHSATASSDMFSLALYSATLLLLLRAATSGYLTLWVLSGVSMGLALLTRSSAIALLVMSAAPWVCASTMHDRLRNTGGVLAGVALPLLTWVLIAFLTGSPLSPQKNYANIAMTFFGGGGFSGDVRTQMGEQFTGLADVLLHDPTHLIQHYIYKGAQTLKIVFTPEEIVALPVVLFVLPGIIIFFLGKVKPFRMLFLLATISHVAVVNFMDYKDRFFLFVVPLFGAAAAVAYIEVKNKISNKYMEYVSHLFVLMLLSFSFLITVIRVPQKLHSRDKELSDVREQVGSKVSEGATIIARKPHISFYAGTDGASFPDVQSFEALCANLKDLDTSRPTFLYYGSQEAIFRSELSELREGETHPTCLELVLSESSPNAWALYRVRDEAVGDADSDM